MARPARVLIAANSLLTDSTPAQTRYSTGIIYYVISLRFIAKISASKRKEIHWESGWFSCEASRRESSTTFGKALRLAQVDFPILKMAFLRHLLFCFLCQANFRTHRARVKCGFLRIAMHYSIHTPTYLKGLTSLMLGLLFSCFFCTNYLIPCERDFVSFYLITVCITNNEIFEIEFRVS